MENLIWLVKSVKFPCALLRGDRLVFQNELFSAHIRPSDLQVNGFLRRYISSTTDLGSVEIETRQGVKVLVTPRVAVVEKSDDIKILTLIDEQNAFAEARVDHMESGRFVALGQLASGIAHEINNPLTVVLAKVHLVEKLVVTIATEHEEIELKIKDALGKAKSSIVRISKVIKGMRSLARDVSNDDFQEIEVASLIQETIELCQERIKENGILLEVDAPSGLFISARPYQIVQVLINLINNAIDAMNSQAIGKISVQVLQSDATVTIQVQDSGPGVEAGYEELIMEPFFTTKVAGMGTGLGLSISRQIVFSHHGKIRLNTAISNSCFEVELPLTERRVA